MDITHILQQYAFLPFIVIGVLAFQYILIPALIKFMKKERFTKRGFKAVDSAPTRKAEKIIDNTPESLNLNTLQDMEWKNFEKLCCSYFIESGLEARETSVGADGGVDINLYKKDSSTPVMIVQCKAHSKNVGVKDIRELYGVLAASEATSSIFMTVKGFTPDAKAFAEGKSPALQLCDGERLLKMIRKLPDDAQKRLLKVATKGDYKTPTCASCDIKMVVRNGKNGKFFGCRNYPRCKMTMVLKS